MKGKDLFLPGTYASIPRAVLQDPDLGATAKIVYLGLASFLDQEAESVWPGAATLRDATGLSRRAVQKGIASLVSARWIAKQTKGGPKGTNRYTFADPRTRCASAPAAPPLAQGVREGSAGRTHEVHQQQVLHQCTPATRAAGQGVSWMETEARFDVSPDLLATWKRDYPQLNVAGEIRKAGQWHAVHHRWRSAFRAALVRWLNRAADNATGRCTPGAGTFAPATAGENYTGLARKFGGKT